MKNDPIPELQGARALVADDDTDTCMSVSKMLRQIGMRADWTVSGKEAVVPPGRPSRRATNSAPTSSTG